MIVTEFTKSVMRARRAERETDRLVDDGWEEVGEDGGKLWQLHRGHRQDHVITDVRIAPDGKSLLIKTTRPA